MDPPISKKDTKATVLWVPHGPTYTLERIMFWIELQRHVNLVVVHGVAELKSLIDPTDPKRKCLGVPKAVILTDHRDMYQSTHPILLDYVEKGGLLLVAALFNTYVCPTSPPSKSKLNEYLPFASRPAQLLHPMKVNTTLQHLAIGLNVYISPITVQLMSKPYDTAVYSFSDEIPNDSTSQTSTPVSLQRRDQGHVGYIGYTRHPITSTFDTLKVIKLTVGTMLAMCEVKPTTELWPYYQNPYEFVAPWNEQVSTTSKTAAELCAFLTF